MKDISAALITVKREGKNYLADTLDALACSDLLTSTRLASFTVKDSGDRGSFAWASDAVGTLDVSLAGQDEPLCGNLNVASALRLAAAVGTPWVLLLEDDIAVIDRFFDSVGAWLDDHASPEVAFYPLGAAYDMPIDVAMQGGTAWVYPFHLFYGTQAVAMTLEVAEELAGYIEEHNQSEVIQTLPDGTQRRVRGTGWDLLMAAWAKASPYEHLLTPAPSFIQHVGMDSSLIKRRAVHTFPSFPGSNWAYPLIKAGKGEAA